MSSGRRITRQTETILRLLLTATASDWWGNQIAPQTGLKSGSLYPALLRMERLGWLISRWEDIDPTIEKRPRRRLYRLTGEGEQVAREIVSRADQRDRVPGNSQRRGSLPGVARGAEA